MGYYLMPEASEPEPITQDVVKAIAREAVIAFRKKHGSYVSQHLDINFEVLKRRVTIFDEVAGKKETYTFMELGFPI